MAPFFVYPTLSLPRHYKTPQNARRRVTDTDCGCCGVYHCDYLAESLEDNAGVRVRVCARVCAGAGVRARVCARAGAGGRVHIRFPQVAYGLPRWRTFPPKWRTPDHAGHLHH